MCEDSKDFRNLISISFSKSIKRNNDSTVKAPRSVDFRRRNAHSAAPDQYHLFDGSRGRFVYNLLSISDGNFANHSSVAYVRLRLSKFALESGDWTPFYLLTQLLSARLQIMVQRFSHVRGSQASTHNKPTELKKDLIY